MTNVSNATGGASSASPTRSSCADAMNRAGSSTSTRAASMEPMAAASPRALTGKNAGTAQQSPVLKGALAQISTLPESLINSLGGAGGKGAGSAQTGISSGMVVGKAGDVPTQSIADIASGNGDFEILTAALEATGLDEAVTGESDLTVFAPTHDAFRTLASETLGGDIKGMSDDEVAEALVETLGADTVADVLRFHVSPGGATVAELQDQGGIETLNGVPLTVKGNELVDQDPDVANPRFIPGLTDIVVTNGTVQAIDRVLLPFNV